MKSLVKTNQRGFTIVEIVIVIVVIAALVIGAKYTYDSVNTASKDGSSQTSDSVPEVNNASDLKNAEDYLNQTDLESLDDSKLDADVDALL